MVASQITPRSALSKLSPTIDIGHWFRTDLLTEQQTDQQRYSNMPEGRFLPLPSSQCASLASLAFLRRFPQREYKN